MPLESTTVTLTYDPKEIETLIKAELIKNGTATSKDKISIRYHIQEVGGDDRMGCRGTDEVTKITATIEKAK